MSQLVIDQVRPSELADWLHRAREHGVPLLLDVREVSELRRAAVQPDGFELAHIPMSVLLARVHELDSQRPTACLCHHGARSMQVAAFLGSRGFEHLANIAGGINAWSRELDPGVPRY